MLYFFNMPQQEKISKKQKSMFFKLSKDAVWLTTQIKLNISYIQSTILHKKNDFMIHNSVWETDDFDRRKQYLFLYHKEFL